MTGLFLKYPSLEELVLISTMNLNPLLEIRNGNTSPEERVFNKCFHEYNTIDSCFCC